MTYVGHFAAVSDEINRARAAALIAAATVLVNAVKRGLTGGYTSGDFVTGNVRSSVTRSEPVITPAEGSIQVGTNVDYAVFWEVGHINLFTRKYERVEVWYPALRDNTEAMRAAYARVFARSMGGT